MRLFKKYLYMKKAITSFILLAAGYLLSGNSAVAQQTQKLTAAKHNDFGITYSLPITHFDIKVNGEVVTRTAGQFYKYSKKYLGIDNPITEDSKELVIESVTVTPYGVPDANNQYLMQFKKGSPSLYLDKNGLPLCLNIDPESDKTVIAETVYEKPAMNKQQLITATASALPGELLVSESTAKKAELAAQTIYKIRESRTAYITGEADQMPPDGEALKVTLAQLDQQEAALMALFIGTTTTEQVSYNFDFVPEGEINNKIIFRLSNYDGLVDKNDLAGAPVYATLKITQKGEIPVDEKGVEKKLPKGAVMYTIPGEALFTLNYEGKEIYSKKIQVAQFGIQYGLDPVIFTDKKAPSYVIFYPETGAIKEIGTLEVQQQ